MTKEFKALALNLQLFAEGAAGGDGGTGAEGMADSGFATTDTKGVKNPLANVKYGKQEDVQTTDVQPTEAAGQAEDLNAKFEELINGEYKEQYAAKVKDTVQKRLKGAKEKEAAQTARLEALSPVLDMLGKKYGVDTTDVEALVKAVEEDDSYFEDEAMEMGITVEQLKHLRKVERENADFKRQMEEQKTQEKAAEIYRGWLEQAEEAQKYYPNFDLETEMQNPKFVDLLRNNIDVKTAFQVLHQDEIIPQMMQHTAKTVEQKIANKIRANGARPTENGTTSTAASLSKSDVSSLTKADRAEIARQVAMGKRIVF